MWNIAYKIYIILYIGGLNFHENVVSFYFILTCSDLTWYQLNHISVQA